MPETETTTELLTADEIAVLNEARTILKRAENGVPFTYNGGRLAEACDRASNAIFQTLNVTNAYSIQRLTDAQLHNESESEAS